MAWDFETEPDFQRKLDWMDEFVRAQVEPLDLVSVSYTHLTLPTKA